MTIPRTRLDGIPMLQRTSLCSTVISYGRSLSRLVLHCKCRFWYGRQLKAKMLTRHNLLKGKKILVNMWSMCERDIEFTDDLLLYCSLVKSSLGLCAKLSGPCLGFTSFNNHWLIDWKDSFGREVKFEQIHAIQGTSIFLCGIHIAPLVEICNLQLQCI